MEMNLLKVIKKLETAVTTDIAQSILNALEERKLFLEIREPMSDGKVHDVWCEKYDGIEDICYIIQELIEEIENEDVGEIEKNIEELQKEIELYQCLYGGLSRLKCDV